jgi:sterol 14-demethylase
VEQEVQERPAGRLWQIKVDRDLCQGHAVCTGEAPEIFLLDNDDKLQILDETPSDDLRKKVKMAVRYCPTRALSIVED